MRPSLASSCVGSTPSFGAARAKSLSSASSDARRFDSETPPIVVLPPDGPLAGYFELPMFTFTRVDRQAEGFGDDHARWHVRVPVPMSWLPSERFDAAVGMDLHGAGRAVPAAAPGVDGHAEAGDDRAVLVALAVRMPLVFPVDQLGGDLHLGL